LFFTTAELKMGQEWCVSTLCIDRCCSVGQALHRFVAGCQKLVWLMHVFLWLLRLNVVFGHGSLLNE
jgi:hypothetical protein